MDTREGPGGGGGAGVGQRGASRRGGSARRPRGRRRLRVGRLIGVLVAMAMVAGGAVATRAIVRAAASMPSLGGPVLQLGETSWIYDRSGKPIEPVPGSATHTAVPLTDIPLAVQHAFVATEDRRFYQNDGLDVRGILRAAFADMTGHPLQGGSTITQQLAKNLYLSDKDTLVRKVKEAWLGLELARTYTKAEILDRYLNLIYLGDGAYGVQAASEAYFGVPVSRVNLAQAALLAAVNAAPSAYDPVVHPAKALARRNLVLELMKQQSYITAAQAKAVESAPLELAPRHVAAPVGPSTYAYPWFVDAVIQQLEVQDHINPAIVQEGGLKIYTTLVPSIQTAAQKAVAGLDKLGGAFKPGAKPEMQVAEAVIDPSTGDVVALIGGRQHTTMLGFDRALQAERQPGSSIKPLVDYIPALEDGMTPGTVVDDAVATFHVGRNQWYTPTNYDHLYYGLTTFTEALRRSVNVVAVKVLNRVGVQAGLQNAVRMGLPLTKADEHLAVALGGTTDCCTPLDMARSYAAIANGGFRVRPRLITKVVRPNGQVMLSNPVHLQRAVPAQVAYVMTKMLEAVDNPQPNHGWDVLSGPYDSNWGTGYDATVHDNVPGWPTAGKTGTSNSNEDAWYVGFTAKYAAAVWLGYDKKKPFPGLYGGTYAGPIFRKTMEAAVAGLKPVHFPRPTGIVQAPIDIKAAPWMVALPGPLTPKADVREEWFVQGTQPTQPSTLWVRAAAMPGNPHLLWSPVCGGQPDVRTYLDRPMYSPAMAQTEAKAAGLSNWKALIPMDMSLAPPTQSCTGATPGALAPSGVPLIPGVPRPGAIGQPEVQVPGGTLVGPAVAGGVPGSAGARPGQVAPGSLTGGASSAGGGSSGAAGAGGSAGTGSTGGAPGGAPGSKAPAGPGSPYARVRGFGGLNLILAPNPGTASGGQ